MNAAAIQSIAAATIPTLAVLVGILISRTDAARLGHEIATLRSELRSEIATLRSELRGEIGELRTQQHNDMLRLFEILGEHAQRIARLEAR